MSEQSKSEDYWIRMALMHDHERIFSPSQVVLAQIPSSSCCG
jgi:hypothetical protein